jgi:hypothetical protein
VLAKTLSASVGESDEAFARAAFSQVLGRPPRDEEIATCRDFLASGEKSAPASADAPAPRPVEAAAAAAASARARENLVLVLFNHHDFVTIR